MFPYINDCNLKNTLAMVMMIKETRVTNVADHLTKTNIAGIGKNTTQTLSNKVHHEKNNTEGIHPD